MLNVSHRRPPYGKTQPGVLELARETANGFSQLLSQHLKVAQLEAVVELHTAVRRAGIFAVLSALMMIGYVLMIVGLAVAIGNQARVGTSLMIVGGVHILIASVGFVVAPRRDASTRIMGNTSEAISRTLAVFEEVTAQSADAPAPKTEQHNN